MPCGSSKTSNAHVDQADKNGENQHCAFEDLDHSILQHPLHSGVRNVKQILKCMQTGTKEIKDIILNECNIIYECKVCASLFRSLANFMYHKRCYCKKHLCEEMVLFDNFEENVVVQPEPPIENITPVVKEAPPKLLKCTVDLVKTDLGNEKSVLVLNDGIETGNSSLDQTSKGAKPKESIEKKLAEVKTEQTMISRRTRDKKSQRGKKKAIIETKVPSEQPKKIRKVTEEPCQMEEQIVLEQTSAKKDSKLVEEPSEVKDNPSEQVSPNKMNETKESNMADKTDSEEIPPKDSTEETVCKKQEEFEITERVSTTKDLPELSNSLKSKEGNKECNNTDHGTLEKSDKVEENIETGSKVDNLSKKIILKPMKKIIFAKPRAIEIKNAAVYDSIRKTFKPEKIGLTNITNAAGNNVQFPKIVLKTIDGNPHAVFQSSEKQISNAINSKNPIVQNKTENEKLIIVLKKDSITTTATTLESATLPEKSNKNLTKQTEFHHLTRRKRLLARNDCSVQQLKCLTCNTTFTSLKTLYYHMLAIHSKKRLYYPCPLCKTLFVQIYGVTRHLVSIHNKTKEQINKLRDVIKKKSIWKKVDDGNTSKNNLSTEKESDLKEESEPEIKNEPVTERNTKDAPAIKTIIKLSKNVSLHQCSKCSRVFGRKSSQVSHEKFCIMNAIKVETVDVTASPPVNPPSMISFLSFSTKKQATEQVEPIKPVQTVKPSPPSDTKVSIRPKRRAEKQMHKDFVNSQTLKWRSVNRVTPNPKVASVLKKDGTKKLEKKVSNIMNVENLACLKCGKKFSSYSNLKRHVAIHVGWTRFKCKHCEYQAYNKSQCWFHVQKAHNVSNNDLEKSVQNLGNWFSKKPMLGRRGRPPKCLSEGNEKVNNKTSTIPKLKISKKKSFTNATSERKCSQSSSKESTDCSKEIDHKKGKNQTSENKKEMGETKKETAQNSDTKKELNDVKKEKAPSTDTKRELTHKKEKTESAIPVYKCNVPDYKKDLSNYKSVTTNNPTTIILSKKLPTSSVQSIMTIPTDSQSSTLANKTFPLRSSPRKVETKSTEGKTLTSLVTRSTAYSKGPIQIKISPPRTNCSENVKKTLNQTSEKTYMKKDKLISEWFPKKDLNSNTSRRESAPLIIGLVPASSSGLSIRTKNPAVTYEKNN